MSMSDESFDMRAAGRGRRGESGDDGLCPGYPICRPPIATALDLPYGYTSAIAHMSLGALAVIAGATWTPKSYNGPVGFGAGMVAVAVVKEGFIDPMYWDKDWVGAFRDVVQYAVGAAVGIIFVSMARNRQKLKLKRRP